MFNEPTFKNIIDHQKNEHVIEEEKILSEVVKNIQEVQEHKEGLLGKGATAKAFVSKTNPDVCYKIIYSDGDYNFRNTVHEEAELLARAHQISKSCKVKVPKPYYSIITQGDAPTESLVMERMHATSIREILEGNLDVDPSFDFKEFVAQVEDFFAKLNAQNIFHRDAHWGNIMVEDGTNVPCIIDFGASIENRLSSEDPYRQINFNNETVVFTPDEYKIKEELRTKFRTYLFKKYGNIHNL